MMAAGRRYFAALLLVVAAAAVGANGETQLDLRDVALKVLERDGSAAKTVAVSGPKGGPSLVLDHTQSLKGTFGVADRSGGGEPLRPQQAFLRLTNRASGDAAYFAALQTKDGSMSVALKSADVAKQVGSQSGAYEAALLLGDSGAAAPLLWVLAEVEVLLPPLDDGSQPAPQPLRVMDSLYRAKPEIVHMHRQPEKRAPAVVSLLFTAVAVGPLLLFALLALRSGANLKAFPTSGAGFLWAAGFHAGLVAVLLLYLLFWMKLNLLQTLPPLAGLAALTAVVGSKALADSSGGRHKQE